MSSRGGAATPANGAATSTRVGNDVETEPLRLLSPYAQSPRPSDDPDVHSSDLRAEAHARELERELELEFELKLAGELEAELGGDADPNGVDAGAPGSSPEPDPNAEPELEPEPEPAPEPEPEPARWDHPDAARQHETEPNAQEAAPQPDVKPEPLTPQAPPEWLGAHDTSTTGGAGANPAAPDAWQQALAAILNEPVQQAPAEQHAPPTTAPSAGANSHGSDDAPAPASARPQSPPPKPHFEANAQSLQKLLLPQNYQYFGQNRSDWAKAVDGVCSAFESRPPDAPPVDCTKWTDRTRPVPTRSKRADRGMTFPTPLWGCIGVAPRFSDPMCRVFALLMKCGCNTVEALSKRDGDDCTLLRRALLRKVSRSIVAALIAQHHIELSLDDKDVLKAEKAAAKRMADADSTVTKHTACTCELCLALNCKYDAESAAIVARLSAEQIKRVIAPPHLALVRALRANCETACLRLMFGLGLSYTGSLYATHALSYPGKRRDDNGKPWALLASVTSTKSPLAFDLLTGAAPFARQLLERVPFRNPLFVAIADVRPDSDRRGEWLVTHLPARMVGGYNSSGQTAVIAAIGTHSIRWRRRREGTLKPLTLQALAKRASPAEEVDFTARELVDPNHPPTQRPFDRFEPAGTAALLAAAAASSSSGPPQRAKAFDDGHDSSDDDSDTDDDAVPAAVRCALGRSPEEIMRARIREERTTYWTEAASAVAMDLIRSVSQWQLNVFRPRASEMVAEVLLFGAKRLVLPRELVVVVCAYGGLPQPPLVPPPPRPSAAKPAAAAAAAVDSESDDEEPLMQRAKRRAARAAAAATNGTHSGDDESESEAFDDAENDVDGEWQPPAQARVSVSASEKPKRHTVRPAFFNPSEPTRPAKTAATAVAVPDAQANSKEQKQPAAVRPDTRSGRKRKADPNPTVAASTSASANSTGNGSKRQRTHKN